MTEMRQFLRGLTVFQGDLPVFDPDRAPERPEVLFGQWLHLAAGAGVREPHAMTLSTVGTDGDPSARVLILKNVDENGWQFAVHAGSPKGHDLAAHPAAALTFHWREQARQMRVRGPVSPAPAADSAADFLARPAVSRAEALLGRQSRPLDQTGELTRAVRESRERVRQQPDLVEPAWTLYTLRAGRVEFWQGDTDREHVRLEYLRDGESWRRHRLWP
ncbi:pyridoxal 5'-phosphate synthase [Kineosporia sp. J2-2]|uniref:Pyridoxal 5'-phosphate synthase n=1 Tax=Kineosporia corallincola TaxID=2835133 RepID=A0ABS5TRD7_9ACTN|nr:pyridoxal 5'-phosphate synthase [Kineosporia corallincola]MBT0773363.1 pyridoxal 5'-phosphate synthase [Kineosporia corallincola]